MFNCSNRSSDLAKFWDLAEVVGNDGGLAQRIREENKNNNQLIKADSKWVRIAGFVGTQEGRYTKGGPLPTVNPIRQVMPSSIPC